MSGTEKNIHDVEFDGVIFRKSLPLQMELQEVLRVLGVTDERVCLDAGSTNAMFSYQLRRSGGEWHTLTTDAASAARLGEGLEADVGVWSDEAPPFPKHTFDSIVVTGRMLEHQDSDAKFVESCHRMLKPDGRLIVCVTREKRTSLLNPLMRLLFPQEKQFESRYSESHLFSVLKSGFDVSSIRTYMRFFTAVVDVVVLRISRRRMDRTSVDQKRFYSVAGVFYWVAFQLDALLLMTRGHRMIAVSNRRAWRSREAPVLSDGRSISEAVLKPIS